MSEMNKFNVLENLTMLYSFSFCFRQNRGSSFWSSYSTLILKNPSKRSSVCLTSKRGGETAEIESTVVTTGGLVTLLHGSYIRKTSLLSFYVTWRNE